MRFALTKYQNNILRIYILLFLTEYLFDEYPFRCDPQFEIRYPDSYPAIGAVEVTKTKRFIDLVSFPAHLL